MNRNIIAIIFTFLLLSSFASAELIVNKYTNDFTAESPNNEQLKLCSCETKVDRIIVQNVGNFYADFHVSINSRYPSKIRVPMQDFQLAPKHFQEVLIYIEESCQVRGVYDYEVVVTNSYGRERIVDRSIRVDMCENTGLDVSPDNVTVGLCNPAVFTVNVTNIGTYADSFTLNFGQYDGIAKLPLRSMYLTAGQSYAQNVSFQFACSDFGVKTVPFVLTTEKNGPGQQTFRNVDVVNQYNYALNVPTSVDVCAKTTTAIPFNISNTVDATNDVHLDINAPEFVSITHDVHLNAFETKNITFTATPDQPGVYPMTVVAFDRFGHVQKERDITLNAHNCYSPAIEIRESATAAITNPLTTCCGAKTFYVNVRNDGDRVQTFDLKVDGPSFFVLDETTVRLEPHQNVNVPLRATLPCSDQEYGAIVTVSPTGQSQVNRSAYLSINSQTTRTCHMVQIDEDELEVTENMRSVPVIVKHTGSAGGNYSIVTNSTIFTIQEDSIIMQPGDQRAVHLVPTVNLSNQELGRYIVLPTFTFIEQSIDYNESLGVELQEKGLWTRFMEWLARLLASMTFCAWIIFLLLLLLIILLIILLAIYAGRPIFAEGLKPRTLLWFKSVLLILIVLLLIFMIFLRAPDAEMQYERVAETTNTTVLEWYQNTELTIDVSPYFSDPDKDSLVYSVSQPQDISVHIERNMLTLTPDHNFAGENTMVITANDERGGVTDSPIFILRVIPRKQLTFIQWLGVWCHYIVLIELILLLLILFLMVLTIKEYRPKPFANNVLVVVNREKREVKRVTKRVAKKTTAKKAVKRVKKRKTRKPQTRARAGARSRALVVAPTRRVTAARGRQVESVVKEFRGSGQTVNIAVGQQPHTPAVVAVPGYKPNEIIYIGSKAGNTVHTPYCMNARRIPKNKRIAYSTKREAVSAGLVPCKMCRPFEGGI
jgi:hypothetical protein